MAKISRPRHKLHGFPTREENAGDVLKKRPCDSPPTISVGDFSLGFTSRKLSYFIDKILKNWEKIDWWKDAIKIGFFRYTIRNKGTYIMEEDWDNLLILDACRYDMFKENNNISGKMEHRISLGSCTSEFLLNNFGKRRYLDTVYITANPLVDCHVPNCFYKIIQVWKDGWDAEYETVLPKTMVNYSLNAQNLYPDKRLIIHFVQPHYPFLGENARKEIGDHAGLSRARSEAMGNKYAFHKTQPIWNLFKEGKIKKITIWNAYKENLDIALKYVKKLTTGLKGKTIISSDHGNLFGEIIPPFFSREYGHPCNIYVRSLVKVPWFIVEKKDRKRIVTEEKADRTILEKKQIKSVVKRLKNI